MAGPMAGLTPADFYQRVAGDYNLPVHRAFYQRIAGELLARVPALPGKSILEVGAGTGFATAKINDLYPDARIVALEPARAMLAEAGGETANVRWVCGSLDDLPPDNFDLVVSSMSYHWLNPAERRKLMDLAAGGVLALALPVTDGRSQTEVNRALKGMLFNLRGDENWPKQARKESAVLATVRSRFKKVEVADLRIDESYSTPADLINCLYIRGAFFSLFGDRTGAATERLESLFAGRSEIEFSWSIKLIVAE